MEDNVADVALEYIWNVRMGSSDPSVKQALGDGDDDPAGKTGSRGKASEAMVIGKRCPD